MTTSSSRAPLLPDWERASGVLLHPTSLPEGRFGSDALRFIDWLADAGQRWWQVLPLGPPDRHGSPYASASAFAGSPTLLAQPDAAVTLTELEEFIGQHWYWAAGWERHGGIGALQDQVRFDREWGRIRRHAADRGIRVLGDLPFYVAPESADLVDHPDLFALDEIAGVPPDDWSATGQLWSNPVYDWRAMRHERFRWWVERFRREQELFDAIRIDHFRGFVAYWSIPRGSATAELGRWRRGPGLDLFDAVRTELGDLRLVAENLGLITPAVESARRRLGMPGTVVLQFVFTDTLLNPPPRTAATDDVVYTGTHDNDTIVGWWNKASVREHANVDRALEEIGLSEPEPQWKMIRLALHHQAAVCMFPAQDLLGLDSSARMNWPGRPDGNWSWRLEPGMLTSELARRLKDETLRAAR
jgi:4-alpha-glucanotransferase